MNDRKFRIWFSKKRAMVLTALGIPRGFFIQYNYMDSIISDMHYPALKALCDEVDLQPVFFEAKADE